MFQQKSSKGSIFSTILFSGLLLAISILLIVNKQYILDQISVWSYKPSSEISALAERAGMSDYGKFLYLASQPKLDGTQDFNTECSRIESTTSILGCYSDYKIYIYDVTDAQLDGIREVTAGHETLHAAYIRLSSIEKDKVDKLLEAEYEKLKTNQEFSDLMKYYSRAEPGQRHNELHSLIGTQVANISPDLEAHYDKYFSNRSEIVLLNEKYSTIFKELETKANELLSEMNSLSDDISSRIKQYNSDAIVLNNDITAFNKRADSGDFSSQYAFNQERAILGTRVTELSSARVEINSDITKYDSLLNEYNSIASQSEKLKKSVDSTLAPAPSV